MSKITIVFLLFIVACTAKTTNKEALNPMAIVYYNSIDEGMKNALRIAIKQQYNLTVYESYNPKYIYLPDSAFCKPRNRYRADVLLNDLINKYEDVGPILGVTTADISTTKNGIYDWGIIGLGKPGGTGVISTYRIKSEDKKLFTDRFVKVGLHEIGHVLGLNHCPDPLCYMHDAEGSGSSIDKEELVLCTKCRSILVI